MNNRLAFCLSLALAAVVAAPAVGQEVHWGPPVKPKKGPTAIIVREGPGPQIVIQEPTGMPSPFGGGLTDSVHVQFEERSGARGLWMMLIVIGVLAAIGNAFRKKLAAERRDAQTPPPRPIRTSPVPPPIPAPPKDESVTCPGCGAPGVRRAGLAIRCEYCDSPL